MSSIRDLVRLATCFLLFAQFAWGYANAVKVTIDGSVLAFGSDTAVHITLVPNTKLTAPLPHGSKNASACFEVCSVKNEKDSYHTGLGFEVFCNENGHTLLATSPVESVQELAVTGNIQHTFAQKVKLPAHPVDTKIWILVRLDYETPNEEHGLHHSLYGAMYLLERCTSPSKGEGKAATLVSKVTCNFYTLGGLAPKNVIGNGLIKPPNQP